MMLNQRQFEVFPCRGRVANTAVYVCERASLRAQYKLRFQTMRKGLVLFYKKDRLFAYSWAFN
jgi:hypothetical protein